ncbi:hypothetical protein SAMN05444671_0057 [Flavobacterium sp. CF108]|uniref:hypothetical protein n=1 Tax=unclassified Flavobacterium TaxID=196869 RepID=UPI0008C1189C|nr:MULTISPECIES: hypothetical protein [unclassified Flavobacterium]SEP32294.1 hypothetical protein SAMN04487978_0559 [Flavobacterium sp. fv08]SHI04287.1 hypothetical protein SAMN05444671_0057 [Flavobacterium sp. CF108]
MIKKFLLLSLVASQLMVSCSSDESNDEETKPETELSLEEQIAALLKQPYSSLTPSLQKTKLEAEANQMLVELDKTKSSGAIEALANLSRLLGVDEIDVFGGKRSNKVEDILNVSGVYGIYTWNNAEQVWVKTASTTELKFVFPAKESQTANNAVLSAKGISSDVKVKSYDSWVSGTEIYDSLFLPSSADAVLTIDNGQSATFALTAKYSNGKEVPNEFSYKMVLNDGYTWEMSSIKAAQNTAKASLIYNGKTLIDFTAGSNANIDNLLDNKELVQYRGKANGLFQLMDNFVIVADMDLATAAADDIALEKTLPNVNYNSKTYYTDHNAYNLKLAEGEAANFNKNMKLILVSKKDGTKIADIVQHAEKEYSYDRYNKWVTADNEYGGYWEYDQNTPQILNYYYVVNYLRFNDKTEVEMGAYFSEGFDTFESKFEDFISAFNKEEK